MSAPAEKPSRKEMQLQAITMQMQKLGINSEHFSSVQQINQYLEQHRINQLFNVSLRTDSFISRPPANSNFAQLVLFVSVCRN